MAWREDAHINKLRVGANALVQNVDPVVLTAAKTLTKADNGTTYFMAAAAGKTITLPEPLAGLKFKFVVALAFITTNWIVVTDSAAAIIEGNLIVVGAAVPASNEKQINFVLSAESLGDYIELESDGTSWFVNGIGGLTGSITATAP